MIFAARSQAVVGTRSGQEYGPIPRIAPGGQPNAADTDTLTNPLDPMRPLDDGIPFGGGFGNCDNCQNDVNPWQEDADGDLLGDACDPCTFISSNEPCVACKPRPQTPPVFATRVFDQWIPRTRGSPSNNQGRGCWLGS